MQRQMRSLTLRAKSRAREHIHAMLAMAKRVPPPHQQVDKATKGAARLLNTVELSLATSKLEASCLTMATLPIKLPSSPCTTMTTSAPFTTTIEHYVFECRSRRPGKISRTPSGKHWTRGARNSRTPLLAACYLQVKASVLAQLTCGSRNLWPCTRCSSYGKGEQYARMSKPASLLNTPTSRQLDQLL